MSLYCKIYKKYPTFTLDMDFSAENETVALTGASGSGKSLTLKCIAGIEKPDKGKIVLNGVTLFDSEKHINLSPQKRQVGYLFQDYALFPNMTVKQNIKTGLPKQRKGEISNIISAFRLTGLENHYPHQLSGGQKQRCAIARMMAARPRIIMLDEPFSALDSYLKWELEREITDALQSFDNTVLFVSHDRDEVYRICDKALVISDGKNEEMRTKHELFEHPLTYADALLTGCKNLAPAKLLNGAFVCDDYGISFDTKDTKTVENVSFMGIRARKMKPAFLIDEKDRNDFVFKNYEIESVTEGMFSFILMIKLENAKTPLRWEILKDVYLELSGHEKTIAIPKNEIMMLAK